MQDDNKPDTPRGPLIHFLDVWKRTSGKTGRTYYSGYLAGVKLIGFEETLADRDQPVIRFYVQPTDKAPPEVLRKPKATAASGASGAGKHSREPDASAARAHFSRPAKNSRDGWPDPNDDLDFIAGHR